MKRFISYITFFIFVSLSLNAQQNDSLRFAYKNDSIQSKRAVNKAIYGNARKATIMSACFPGLGQIYNRKYWKAPVIYVALGGIGYWGVTNQIKYKYYSTNLKAIHDEDANTGVGSTDKPCFIEDTIYNNCCTTQFDTIYHTTCNPYFFNGELRTITGFYYDSLVSNSGCDSLITLFLTLNYSTFTFSDSACNSYFFNGQTITNSGTYYDTLMNANGCDSLITLNLTINQTDTSLPFYPASNLFISVRISSFRAMFIMENFSQYFRNDYNFDIVNHPQFDPKFRMGFRWLLKD